MYMYPLYIGCGAGVACGFTTILLGYNPPDNCDLINIADVQTSLLENYP